MKQVYEVHYVTMEVLGFFTPMICLLCFCVGFKLLRKMVDVSEEHFELVKRLILGFTCVLQLMIIIYLLSEHIFIYLAYHNNNYLTVEGMVQNFEGDAAKERFEVSGVKFYYDSDVIGESDGLGYDVVREKGGVITGNGQRVRIGYVKYLFNNVIVAIWTDE